MKKTAECRVEEKREATLAVVEKIISGGQTGADRAALDIALELGMAVGGWVPRGRSAEDGTIPDGYPDLTETDSQDSAIRTELNVRDSDATLLLSHGELVGGASLTLEIAHRTGRPHLHIDLRDRSVREAVTQLQNWLANTRPKILNVAGPRSSEDPEIFEVTKCVLAGALSGRSFPPGLRNS